MNNILLKKSIEYLIALTNLPFSNSY